MVIFVYIAVAKEHPYITCMNSIVGVQLELSVNATNRKYDKLRPCLMSDSLTDRSPLTEDVDHR